MANNDITCQNCYRQYWITERRSCVQCKRIGCVHCMVQCYCCSINWGCEHHLPLSSEFCDCQGKPQPMCCECEALGKAERRYIIKERIVMVGSFLLAVAAILLAAGVFIGRH